MGEVVLVALHREVVDWEGFEEVAETVAGVVVNKVDWGIDTRT
jgi:hypothetical protein